MADIFKDRSILYGYEAWFREPDGHVSETIFAADYEEAVERAKQVCGGRNLRFKEVVREPVSAKNLREIPIEEFRIVEEFRREWRNAKAMSSAFDQILGNTAAQ